MRLRHRVAIVTGAGQGIGREYALALCREGARVCVADIDGVKAQNTVRLISDAGGKAIAVAGDISKAESCTEIARKTSEIFGGIDILVNNAAIYDKMKSATLLDFDLDYYNHFISVNVTGQMLATRAVVPYMQKRGRGKIIFQASNAAIAAPFSIYGLAKLTVVGMTKGYAKLLGPYNINVNAIGPGVIETEATLGLMSKADIDRFLNKQPISRIGHPSDLTGGLIFLSSDESDYVTGQFILINGGYDDRI